MVQKVNFSNLRGDTLSVGNTTITGTGVTVGGTPLTGGSGGATQYANTASLPKTDLTFGEFALIGNTLFITNGTGWYSVGLINQSPSLSISVSDISLGPNDNTINFTYTASDPDGPEPTVTAELVGANTSQANVTLYTSNSTVTVENLSATDYSANIVLTATDGIDQTFGTVILTVFYVSELWDETSLSIGTSSTNSLDNSTFIDRSTNAHTVTPTGSPVQTAFHPYLDNWGVSLQSDTAYVTIADDPTLNLTGEFTIEVWYKQYAYGTNNSRIFQRGANSITGYCLLVRDDGTVKFGRTDEEIVGYNQNLSDGQWHHHAVTRDASNNVRIFFDGVLKDTATLSDSLTQSGALHIGAFPGGTSTNRIDGDFSNFRLVTGSALYTSNFTPSTTPLTDVSGTQVLTLQDNRFVDNSSNNLTVTPVNGAAIIPSSPFGQGSEYAAGENKGSVFAPDESANHYMTASWNAMPSGTEDFTMQFWAYQVSNITSFGYFGQRPTSGNNFQVYNNYPTAGVYLLLNDTALQVGTNRAVPLGEWVHYAFTRSGNTFYGFINGELIDTVSSSVSLTKSFTDMYIMWHGVNSSSAGDRSMQNAYMADLNIIRGTAVYTSTFTPPTAPVGNTNASLYLPMDNAGIFDKTGNHTLTLNGDAATSTSQTKFADTAMYFDGTGDKITTSGSSIGNFGTGDFTIEFWMRAESLSGYNSAIADDTYASNATPNAWCFYLNGTSLNPWKGGTSLMSGGTLSTNTWHHLAWTRSNGTMYLFLDGTQVDTTTDSTSFNYGDIIIGSNSTDYYLQGYLENVQILKGIAKYIASFTPPTQEQGRQYQAES